MDRKPPPSPSFFFLQIDIKILLHFITAPFNEKMKSKTMTISLNSTRVHVCVKLYIISVYFLLHF